MRGVERITTTHTGHPIADLKFIAVAFFADNDASVLVSKRTLPRFGTRILASPFDAAEFRARTYHRGMNFN
jgi:hypothetical protein